MPKIAIKKPSEHVDHLVSIFPAFGQEWDEGEAFGSDGDYTYHTVFFVLGSQSFKLFSEALGNTPQFWLNLQRNWELWHALQNHKEVKPLLLKASALLSISRRYLFIV